MKNILHAVMLAVVWLAGGIFFFLLVIYISVSFFGNRFRQLLRWKGLYNFREKDFSALNVMYDSGKNIPIGKLPVTKGEISTYYVPLSAKEILLEFKFSASADTCVELDYCLSCNDAALKKEYVYIFMNPFSDSGNLNYDKTLLWYPLPEDRILKVQFTDVKSPDDSLKNMEGYLNIVQVR